MAGCVWDSGSSTPSSTGELVRVQHTTWRRCSFARPLLGLIRSKISVLVFVLTLDLGTESQRAGGRVEPHLGGLPAYFLHILRIQSG